MLTVLAVLTVVRQMEDQEVAQVVDQVGVLESMGRAARVAFRVADREAMSPVEDAMEVAVAMESKSVRCWQLEVEGRHPLQWVSRCCYLKWETVAVRRLRLQFL